MKRPIPVVLGLLLLFAAPTVVQAQTGSGDGYNYILNPGGTTVTITNYTGPSGAVTIPTNINDLTVTGIGKGGIGFEADYVFKNTGVTSVIIPSSVTNIGGYAFALCTSLASVTIASSVTNIGGYAFEDCTSLNSVYFEGNPPTVISSVFIGDNATVYYLAGTTGWSNSFAGLPAALMNPATIFNYTTNAGNITITGYTGSGGVVFIPALINGLPATNSLPVTGIGNGEDPAFVGTGVTGILVPSNVTNIGDFAFSGCTNLTVVFFQGNAPTADATAFTGDTNATACYSSNTTGWGTQFAGLSALAATPQTQFTWATNAGGTNITITSYTGPVGAVVIPPFIDGFTVSSIGSGLRPGVPSFPHATNFTIPGNATSIGAYAFSDCTSLNSVTIATSVTNIGTNAFDNCPSLASIVIPDSVTSIGEDVFFECTSLTNVTLPNSVTSIGTNAFNDCTGLTCITIPNSVTNIGYSAFQGSGLTCITIPGSVASIEYAAFASCSSLTNVTIANGVTNVGGDMFYNCTKLSSVTMPGSVTSIEEWAFAGANLTNITLPGGLTSIGDYAFDQTSLTSITIPGNVTSIGTKTFSYCYSLTNVYFEGNAPSVGSETFIENPTTVYYLFGTTGWSNTFAYSPSVPAVLWKPLIQAGGANFGVQNNQFGFNITGTNNFTVVVETCTNLSNPVWVPLTTNTLVNGLFHFSEPFQPGTSERFYGLGLP